MKEVTDEEATGPAGALDEVVLSMLQIDEEAMSLSIGYEWGAGHRWDYLSMVLGHPKVARRVNRAKSPKRTSPPQRRRLLP